MSVSSGDTGLVRHQMFVPLFDREWRIRAKANGR